MQKDVLEKTRDELRELYGKA